MSVKRWMGILTEIEFQKLNAAAFYGEDWFHQCPDDRAFEFGDIRDEIQDEAFEAFRGKPLDGNVEPLLNLLSETSAWDTVQESKARLEMLQGKSMYIHFFTE